MKPTVWERIEALMDAQEWDDRTLEALAERVRRAGATNVKRQHISQLREFPNRQPRYTRELAAVFGLTTDEFMELPIEALRTRAGACVREPTAQYAASIPFARPAARPSQPVGIDPDILVAATKVLLRVLDANGVHYDPVDDAPMLAQLYNAAVEAGGAVSAERNVVMLADWVAKRRAS